MEPEPRDTAAEPNRRPAPNLERDKVVASALQLLNEVGFEGLTLRRLADRLGVKAAALYWHFKNKQDLIDQVAIKILDIGEGKRLPADADWQTILRRVGHHSRTALMRYRDGALLIANADLMNAAAPQDRREMLIKRLAEHGFTPQLTYLSIYVIGRYTLGCVIEEQSDPSAARRDSSPQDRFEAGLELIIAGIAQKIIQ